ncbi:hypothetical protein CAPTEDRAFT_227009 [Capitella teleta]|uniref:Uncharacterized protein n=1 Tax=Capitella teleta TaxID=283909 RepID=R7VIG2_CAPTE|nr:hypothetical protein CAPTEDRAFT_227009 [Capitella teleta]|eukprot:ELU18628.1 hypothetical protein CAPTEDRAFT_227009 [Capitella teleta]
METAWAKGPPLCIETVLEVSGQEEECPENWREEPVKRCHRDLLIFMSSDHAHLSAEERIDQQCALWQQTRQCFRDLITTCPDYAGELQRRMMRHSYVSVPCYDDQLRYREIHIDCYSKFIGATRTCRGGFDKYYYEMVMNDEFSDACRVLAAVVKCLHGQKQQVAVECKPGADTEYHRNYITPLLEQVSPPVKSRCKMKPPYDQYLGGVAASSANVCLISLLLLIVMQ